MFDLRDYLARHLNDHQESARGVRQPTFFTWNENHVASAVDLALAFLYSLIPERFSKVKEFTVEEEDCIISFCEDCGKFLGIVDIEIDGQKCLEISESTSETNSLLGLFSIPCYKEDDSTKKNYSWSYIESSTCVVKFEEELPKGTKLRYMCAEQPSIDELADEYLPIVAEYAAWWLFRSDSESKSSLERATHHFEGLKFLVETKLLIEFSLREDDYIFGMRKVKN